MKVACLSPADGRYCPVTIRDGQAWAACGPLSPVVEIIVRPAAYDTLLSVHDCVRLLERQGFKVRVAGRYASKFAKTKPTDQELCDAQ